MVTPIQRMTRQRKVILSTLERMRSHPTVDEVYQQVRKHLPHISLATVYRNLDLLAQNGLLRKLATSGSQARFDGDVSKHYHVVCTCCAKIDDIFEADLEPLWGPLSSRMGYEITGCRIEFEGVCPECHAASKKREERSAVR